VHAVYGVQLLAIRMAQRRLPELTDAIAAMAEAQPGVGAWRAALAMAAAASGHHDLARTSFDTVLADNAGMLDRDQTYSAALVALGTAAVELGDIDRAGAALPHLLPYADRWSWSGSCTLGPMAATLADLYDVVGHSTDAATLRRAADAAVRRMRAPTPGAGRRLARRR
jgi:hypothetical protein